MIKVELLEDLLRYNIRGYDIETLTGKKGEVVELAEPQANKLIKMGLAVEVPDEETEEGSGNSETPPTESETSGAMTTDAPPGDSDDYFTLDSETITRLKGMEKDEIEAILRNYDVEVDKRHTLLAIQEELIEVISTALPEEATISDNVVEYMIKFYDDNFGILLDKANYSEDKVSELTADMGALLKGALLDEDS